MINSKSNDEKVALQWNSKGERRYLKFMFEGHLSLDVAEKTISAWKKALFEEAKSEEKVNLIWNCEKMTGYDGSARKVWQKALSELKSQTGDIWIVSSNPIFRTAAKTMALLTKYNLHSAKSESDIK